MKRQFQLLIAILAWFAVIVQLILMMENRTTPAGETLIRFFSFFTILTNSLVACYFTARLLPAIHILNYLFSRKRLLTALTIYIFMVGIVYQLALRHIWHPTGLQQVVDELLHSVIPVLVLVYWWRHENMHEIKWSFLPSYLLYPLIYLGFVLIRGTLSDFYPYYFIHVEQLGWPVVIRHIGLLLGGFILVSSIFTGLAGYLSARRQAKG